MEKWTHTHNVEGKIPQGLNAIKTEHITPMVTVGPVMTKIGLIRWNEVRSHMHILCHFHTKNAVYVGERRI